jgi:8-oxo-dGTP pyrophosphatase MutT (NUDIX family)
LSRFLRAGKSLAGTMRRFFHLDGPKRRWKASIMRSNKGNSWHDRFNPQPSRCRTQAMDEYTVHAIRPDVEVRVTREMSPLSAALDARIDELWTVAAARVEAHGAGRLFNGRIFSIDTIVANRIEGHLTEYRRQVAQMEDNTLFGVLGIRPLAVVGVTHCADGIVFGRRHAGAVYQPGMWQLCPAGSVDVAARRPEGTMDFRAQLLMELREELGVDADAVGEATPLCLVEHPGSHVCDLGLAIHTSLDAVAITRAHRARGNGEYEVLRVVPVNELAGFIDRNRASIVPSASIFPRSAGWLDHGASPPTGR